MPLSLERERERFELSGTEIKEGNIDDGWVKEGGERKAKKVKGNWKRKRKRLLLLLIYFIASFFLYFSISHFACKKMTSFTPSIITVTSLSARIPMRLFYLFI